MLHDYWGEAKTKFPLPTLRRMHSKTPPSTRQLLTGSVWIASGSLLSIQPGLITRPSPISCARVRPLMLGWQMIRSIVRWRRRSNVGRQGSTPGSRGRWILRGWLLQSHRPQELRRHCRSAHIVPSEVSCFLLIIFLFFVFCFLSSLFSAPVMVCLVRLIRMPLTISDHLRLHLPTLQCHSDTHCISLHNHTTPVAGLNLDQCLISLDFSPMSCH